MPARQADLATGISDLRRGSACAPFWSTTGEGHRGEPCRSGPARSRSDRRRRGAAPRAAGIAGLVFAVLFIVSVILLEDHPAPGASAEEIADWYLRERKVVALIGLYLVLFAGIAFLWFIAVIRDQVGVKGRTASWSTVFLGSGLLFVAMLFAAAASTGGLIDSVVHHGALPPSPDMVVLARSTGYAFIYVFGVRMAAVFVLVSSAIARRTGALPRWLGVIGVAVALVLLLTISRFQIVVLVFPLWVATASVVILVAVRRRVRNEHPRHDLNRAAASARHHCIGQNAGWLSTPLGLCRPPRRPDTFPLLRKPHGGTRRLRWVADRPVFRVRGSR